MFALQGTGKTTSNKFCQRPLSYALLAIIASALLRMRLFSAHLNQNCHLLLTGALPLHTFSGSIITSAAFGHLCNHGDVSLQVAGRNVRTVWYSCAGLLAGVHNSPDTLANFECMYTQSPGFLSHVPAVIFVVLPLECLV